MIISKSKDIKRLESIKIRNEYFDVVETFKLLGVTIDCYLQFNDHVKHIKSAVNKKLSFLYTPVPFKSFILPHFDCCSALTVFPFFMWFCIKSQYKWG